MITVNFKYDIEALELQAIMNNNSINYFTREIVLLFPWFEHILVEREFSFRL